jgi:hypothetical protein
VTTVFTQVAIIITTSTGTRTADIRATRGENLEDTFEDPAPAEECSAFLSKPQTAEVSQEYGA